MKYEVCIKEYREKWIEVEANDCESAQAKIEQMYIDDEITTHEKHVKDVDFMIEEMQ